MISYTLMDTHVSLIRSEMPSRLHGGVAVFIRRTIKIGVKIVDTSHTDLIWIKLCRKFFKLKKDLHIGGIYISPASSNYTKRTNVDKTLFDKLESDIIKFQQNSSVMLLGDLNAHISSDDLDFIYNEEDDVATVPMLYQATMVLIICIHLEILAFISLLMNMARMF